MNLEQRDTLLRLMDRVDALVEAPANRAIAAHWQRYRAGTPSCDDAEGPLYTLDIGIPTWSRILGFDVAEFYTDTYTHLRIQLEMRLFFAEHFIDDTPVGKGFGVSPLGTVLEPSLLGVPIVYRPDTVPWASSERPVLETEAQLDALEQPDFLSAGAMPLVHRMYGETREFVESAGRLDWHVGFPAAIRGILGLAQAMRGAHTNIVLDMLDRPAFARKLFRFTLEFRKHFARERARFLGEPLGMGHIGNDEVCIPSVSPQLYQEFLLPLECELSEFHGGLTCWHSCGDTTRLLPLIRQIPNVHQFYSGPWSDVAAIQRTFGSDTPLELAVHVVDDALAASPERMEARLREIMATCKGAALKLRCGSTDSAFDLKADLAQMRRWTEVARRVTRG